MLFPCVSLVTIVLLTCHAAAAPVQSSIETPKFSSRSGVDDVELRAISRSSWKRDQVNNLIPRSEALHLDYVDGQSHIISCPDMEQVLVGIVADSILQKILSSMASRS